MRMYTHFATAIFLSMAASLGCFGSIGVAIAQTPAPANVGVAGQQQLQPLEGAEAYFEFYTSSSDEQQRLGGDRLGSVLFHFQQLQGKISELRSRENGTPTANEIAELLAQQRSASQNLTALNDWFRDLAQQTPSSPEIRTIRPEPQFFLQCSNFVGELATSATRVSASLERDVAFCQQRLDRYRAELADFRQRLDARARQQDEQIAALERQLANAAPQEQERLNRELADLRQQREATETARREARTEASKVDLLKLLIGLGKLIAGVVLIANGDVPNGVALAATGGVAVAEALRGSRSAATGPGEQQQPPRPPEATAQEQRITGARATAPTVSQATWQQQQAVRTSGQPVPTGTAGSLFFTSSDLGSVNASLRLYDSSGAELAHIRQANIFHPEFSPVKLAEIASLSLVQPYGPSGGSDPARFLFHGRDQAGADVRFVIQVTPLARDGRFISSRLSR